jgi:hypothetical protein
MQIKQKTKPTITPICPEDLERIRNFKRNGHPGLTQLMIIKQMCDMYEKKQK